MNFDACPNCESISLEIFTWIERYLFPRHWLHKFKHGKKYKYICCVCESRFTEKSYLKAWGYTDI